MRLQAIVWLICILSAAKGYAQPSITKLEYFFDADPGYGAGTDVPVTPSATINDLNFSADVSLLSTGFHTLFVRAQDGSSQWSATHSRPFYILDLSVQPRPNLTGMEYFIDADPGFESGVFVTIPQSTDIADHPFTVDLGATPEGFHTLSVRVRDGYGNWSSVHSRPFYILGTSVPSDANIIKLEYFIDAEFGFGLGIDIPVTPATSIADQNFAVDLSSEGTGFHTLFVRAMDANGQWSITHSRPFYILDGNAAPLANIEKVEYFIDTDPGFGLGTDVPVTASTSVNDLAFAIPLDGIDAGFHTLFVRSRDASGQWTNSHSRPFYILDAAAAGVPDLVKVEYFVDTDPGFGAGSDVPVSTAANIDDHAFLVALDTISPGFHTLFVRSQNADGAWSATHSRPFYILNNAVQTPPALSKAEYFFGNDPGAGNGTAIELPGSTALNDHVLPIDLNPLRISGQYTLNVRVQDETGKWSNVESRPLDVCIQPIPLASGATDIIPGSFTAHWQDSAAAPSYKLFVSKDTFNTFITGYEGKEIAALLETVTGLRGGNYQYRVRAVGLECESGLSNFINALLPYIAVSESDSLALVSLFNATAGNSWTNNDNWLSDYVETWNGITLDNFKVVGIDLASNNLVGSVPAEVATLVDLVEVDLSDNRINAIPDFSALPLMVSLDVSGNELDFGDLEPNAGVTGLAYSPQAAIGSSSTTLVDVGNAHTVSAAAGGLQTSYQWLRNNATVPGAVTDTYEIPAVTRATMGDYTCQAINPLLPGLTLTSLTQTVLGTANLSGKLFATTGVNAEAGEMTLLRITSSGGYDTVAVRQVNEDGSFIFEKVILDDYQMLGFADVSQYERALPTYYKNTIYWEEADTLFVETSMADVNITSQLKPLDVPTGRGLIDGYVVEDDGADNGGRVQKPKRVAGAGVSVRRVERVGRGKEEMLTLVAYVFTNDEGEFEFPSLETGEYRLNVQYPGYPMDNESFVTIPIGDALESQKRVEAAVEEGRIKVRPLIVTGIWDFEGYSVDVYPNPTAESLTLAFPSSKPRMVEVVDVTGRRIMAVPAMKESNTIDLTHLQTGSYIVNILEKGQIMKTLHVEKK